VVAAPISMVAAAPEVGAVLIEVSQLSFTVQVPIDFGTTAGPSPFYSP
jgi:hypothetical protein